jgi:glycosyltransferase involved in cell wall biosynthesis
MNKDRYDFTSIASSCFINPFSNHAYFTVRALSTKSHVFIFCPPLQLQLLRGLWDRTGLRLIRPPLISRLVSTCCIFVFLFYKLHCISDSTYLYIFRYLLVIYIRQIPFCRLFVYYQDYLADSLRHTHPKSILLCELIISTDRFQLNYSSTLSAIQSASFTVIPSLSQRNLVETLHRRWFLAPYGGNKIDYRTHSSLFSNFRFRNDEAIIPHWNCTGSIRIVARSNSYRKGADIFLKSLVLLDQMLEPCPSSVTIEVFICGSIIESNIQSEFSKAVEFLRASNQINVKSRQLDSYLFSQLLSTADLFIMPSRLESTSLAALEALWHGIPSILSPQCGVEDFVTERHGRLLIDLHPLALAKIIYSFCINPTTLDFYRACLHEDRQNFTWNAYYEAYNQILGESYSKPRPV